MVSICQYSELQSNTIHARSFNEVGERLSFWGLHLHREQRKRCLAGDASHELVRLETKHFNTVNSFRLQTRRNESLQFLLLVVTLFFVSLCQLHAQSQVPNEERILEPMMQESVQSVEIEDLEFLKTHPLDLRKCASSALSQLPEISPLVAQRIMQFVYKHHTITLDELIHQLQLSELQAAVLRRYCLLRPTASQARIDASQNSATEDLHDTSNEKLSVELRTRQIMGLETTKAQRDGKFAGNALSSYERCTVHSSTIEAGLVCDKDPGEKSTLDFVSAYLSAQVFASTRCIVGDYRLINGLGSVLAPGVMHSKSSNVVAPLMQLGAGLKVSRGTQSNSFFRGAALEQDFGTDSSHWRVCVAYSHKLLDATLDSVTQEVRSVDITGLHRTDTELQKHDQLSETVVASTLEYHQPHFVLNVCALSVAYSHPFIISSTAPIIGNRAQCAAFTTAYQFGKNACNAELGLDPQGKMCFLASVAHEQSDWASVINIRSIAAQYHAPFASSFSSFGSNSNEQGIYLGLFSKLPSHVELRSFIDVFHSLVPRYGFAFCSRGVDLSAELRGHYGLSGEWNIHYHESNQSDAARSASNELQIFDRRSRSLSAQIRQNISPTSTITLNMQHNWKSTAQEMSGELNTLPASQSPVSGSLLSLSLHWQLHPSLACAAHYALYSTDGFTGAVYSAEQMAPGYWSSAPMYDKGARALFSMEWHCTANFSLWLRYDLTQKNDVQAMSSGVTEIAGNTQSRVVMQVDVKW